MDNFLDTLKSVWENNFVRAIVFLVIAFLAAALASFIVKRLCKLLRLDAKLGKWGAEGGKESSALKFIGKLTFLIVFLLFLPATLDALGLESVSGSITDFIGVFVSYLPNIIAALILVVIGIFVGQILSQIISGLLSKTKLDSWCEKFTSGNKKGGNEDEASSDGEETQSSENVKLSAIVGKIVYAFVLLVAIVEALTVLDISAISEPAFEIISAVFGIIPELILAVIIFALGVFLSGILAGLVENLLRGIRFDAMVNKAVPAIKRKVSITRVIAVIIRAVIILFVSAEAIEILGFEVMSGIASGIISYIPMIIKAVIIALVAFFGAGIIDGFMSKNFNAPKPVRTVIRILIYSVAAFMILNQLEFATVIVNYAFIISLSALAVAFAVAFGIGGRDFAKKALDKIDISQNQGNEEKGKDSKKSENESSNT